MLEPKGHYVFKVIFLGDPVVGKTSIVARYVTSSFKENYMPTLGANITSKDYDFGGRRVTLTIWDIAAQEMYKKLREKYYNGVKAVFIVYDVTRPETFQNVNSWVEDIKDFVQKNTPKVLIGNKIDLPQKVDSKAGKKLASEIGSEFIETSAKTGENVDKLFEKVTGNLMNATLRPPQEKKAK